MIGKFLRLRHRLAGFFCLFIGKIHLYGVFFFFFFSFFYKMTNSVQLQSIYAVYFFLWKRKLIIVFPMSKGTFDPVSVLMLNCKLDLLQI